MCLWGWETKHEGTGRKGRERSGVSKPLLNAALNYTELLQAILYSIDLPVGGNEETWAFFGNSKS